MNTPVTQKYMYSGNLPSLPPKRKSPPTPMEVIVQCRDRFNETFRWCLRVLQNSHATKTEHAGRGLHAAVNQIGFGSAIARDAASKPLLPGSA